MSATQFRAYRCDVLSDGTTTREIVTRNIDDLPAGEVLIKVAYAGLNYKDALSATGNRGVTKDYPHTPGIDACGVVETSTNPAFKPGDKVIATSYDLGMNTDGGFAGYIRVPGEWVVPLPEGLDLAGSMILGTAGLTAGIALLKMEQVGQHPGMGKIVVTGASGGLGSMAVAILERAGYEVVAVTGSKDAHDWLKKLGASEVWDRSSVSDDSGRPLLRPQWAGAIDAVGGSTLETLMKACDRNGSIAVCGLVGSPKFSTTVFPLILNGINLLGVDSAEFPMARRLEVWENLGGKWNINHHLADMVTYIKLDDLDEHIQQILKGKTRGRVVINLQD